MAKLTNNLFGRRVWAIVVAVLMIVQLLPVSAIADNVVQADADGVIVDNVRNQGYDGGIDVDTVAVKDKENLSPIGQAGTQPTEEDSVTPIEPEEPVSDDGSEQEQGTISEAPDKEDESGDQIGEHITDLFERPDDGDANVESDPEQGETDPEQGDQPNADDGELEASADLSYYLVGTMNGWTVSSEYKLSPNPAVDGEYMITLYLEEGTEIKVTNADETAWYPEGADNNYPIETSGTYSIYCTPSNGSFSAVKYDTDTLTVTFKKGDVTVATVEVAPGATVGENMPEDPAAPEGQIFVGWKVGEADFTAESPITTNTTVTAAFAEKVVITFDPNTEENGELADILVEVAKDSKIGNQLPEVPTEQGYTTKWVKAGTDEEVTSETVATENFTAVVKLDKITYTVTFVQEDGTETTQTTDVDAGFAINELPAVTPKENKIGKWVYDLNESPVREFTVGTTVFEDTSVYAYYEQNIFTVEFKVDNAHYETLTTAAGTVRPLKVGSPKRTDRARSIPQNRRSAKI